MGTASVKNNEMSTALMLYLFLLKAFDLKVALTACNSLCHLGTQITVSRAINKNTQTIQPTNSLTEQEEWSARDIAAFHVERGERDVCA